MFFRYHLEKSRLEALSSASDTGYIHNRLPCGCMVRRSSCIRIDSYLGDSLSLDSSRFEILHVLMEKISIFRLISFAGNSFSREIVYARYDQPEHA